MRRSKYLSRIALLFCFNASLCIAQQNQSEDNQSISKLSASVSLLGAAPLFQWGLDIDYAFANDRLLEASAVGYRSATSSDERDVYSLRYKSFVYGLKHFYFAGLGLMNSNWKSQSDSYPGADGHSQYLTGRDIIADLGVGSRWQGGTNLFFEIDWLAAHLPIIHIKKPDPVYRDDASDKPTVKTPAHFSFLRAKIGYSF